MTSRPQAPGAKPPNQGPVDWQARSQVLEEALDTENLRRALECIDYVAGYNREIDASGLSALSDKFEAAIAALGLPDEEGEDAACARCGHLRKSHGIPEASGECERFVLEGDGAAPPPRGPAVQGADVDYGHVKAVYADGINSDGKVGFGGDGHKMDALFLWPHNGFGEDVRMRVFPSDGRLFDVFFDAEEMRAALSVASPEPKAAGPEPEPEAHKQESPAVQSGEGDG